MSVKLTPLDIQQHSFSTELRGFAKAEVQGFLDLVGEQMGEVTRELNDTRGELRRVLRELDEHRERETALREAMLTAQRAIEDIREQARKEAELVTSDAEIRADRIMHNAHTRVAKVLEEVSELRRQRVRAIEELRGVLNTHGKILETYELRPDEQVQEGNLAVLDRRMFGAGGVE